jgi:hypothetical protein
VYFAPDVKSASEDLGLPGFWRGYFPSRAASMGAVPAEVVIATFYNFHPDRVRWAMSETWSRADPAAHDRLRGRGWIDAAAPSRSDAPAVRDTGIDLADSLVVPSIDEAGGVEPVALVVGVAAALVVLGSAVTVRLARARRRAAVGR